MALNQQASVVIPEGLLDAIKSFPVRRVVEHCGTSFTASAFDFYATCPACGTKLKLRSFSGEEEIEDLFDAVFEWMADPEAGEAATKRRECLAEEED